MIDIIRLSQQRIGVSDAEIEVEYQGTTIEKYALGFDGSNFQLLPQQTDCLAKDNCGVPGKQPQTNASSSCCDPADGCC